MEEIAVSVLCATYNQEKYIKQALNGFVMQKTNFPFEVIVNDDASTDKTPEIIKEYVNKYPNIIKPIYQKENQYSKGVSITIECLFPKAKGKYLAFCEGDDFWTDENKLQMQYDIMERNPNCHLCLHKVSTISENGKDLDKTYPNFKLKEQIMSAKDFFQIAFFKYSFQTSCYFMKKEDYEKYIIDFVNIRQKFRKYSTGDLSILFYFGQLDGIIYIDRNMSKYRTLSLGSMSERSKKKSNNFKIAKGNCFIEIMEDFDKYTKYKYHKICMDRILYISIGIAKNTSLIDLLFKRRKEIFGRFNLFQKMVLLIYVLFPNLATQLRKIYKIFKY